MKQVCFPADFWVLIQSKNVFILIYLQTLKHKYPGLRTLNIFRLKRAFVYSSGGQVNASPGGSRGGVQAGEGGSSSEFSLIRRPKLLPPPPPPVRGPPNTASPPPRLRKPRCIRRKREEEEEEGEKDRKRLGAKRGEIRKKVKAPEL